jgi:hypothetical protein
MGKSLWTIDAYATPGGEQPVQAFVKELTGQDKVEALALIKLLEEQGNALRRPHSGALGDGLFELRGKQVRIFYMFLPGRVIVLLDGMIKKQDAIPDHILRRVHGYREEVLAARRRKK